MFGVSIQNRNSAINASLLFLFDFYELLLLLLLLLLLFGENYGRSGRTTKN